MFYRSDPNLIPGMGFTLLILLIVVAFQWMPARMALPIAANADPRPAQPNEIVLRIYASGLMELSVVDEWSTTVGSSYRQPHTPADLERELRRLYAERTADRVQSGHDGTVWRHRAGNGNRGAGGSARGGGGHGPEDRARIGIRALKACPEGLIASFRTRAVAEPAL